jgi:GT2 family glycosyltransferase
MKVSVVIPNYNGEKLLTKNLPAVIKACPRSEIIVVDDASTDNSIKILENKFPHVKIVRNKKNLRFAKACNKGAKAAKGELILFLNSDVSPEKDFLKPLLKHFKDEKVFSVGCKEKENKNGVLHISGRTEGEIQKGLLVHWKPEDQEYLETLWNFGGSMIVDRSKFISIGGFDHIYSPAYWEDIDLCWQAKKHDWKVLFEKDSIVNHNHETTNKSVFGDKKIEQISLRNQIIFSLKHFPFIFYLWLPYHLLTTNVKTKGLFAKAFIKALKRFYL